MFKKFLTLSITVSAFVLVFVLLFRGNALAIQYETTDTIDYEVVKRNAKAGNSIDQYNLGLMYEKGDGVGQNYAESVKWYRKSAEQGHMWAQLRLGLLYYNGKGVPVNKKEAVKWYRKAAEQGDSRAQYCLGLCYYKGEGVRSNKSEVVKQQNRVEAAKWFVKAAYGGHPKAQTYLGIMWLNGDGGLKESRSNAVQWLRLAAQQGDNEAQSMLNKLGEPWANVTVEEAAVHGDPEAQFKFAWSFFHYDDESPYGRGPDKSKAFIWYRRAAEQGHSDAQLQLAFMYLNGHGTEYNKEEALKWAQMSARQGNAMAREILGKTGLGW